MAKWAFEYMEETVLSLRPDAVTLWWGGNDLLGCPGFFDRTTNGMILEKLDFLAARQITYLYKQIDVLLAEEWIRVFAVTGL